MYRNKENVLCVSEKELRERAEQLFWEMSGFSKENLPSSYQLEEIKEVWFEIKEQINVRILVKKVENYRLEEKSMWIETEQIAYDLPISLYQETVQGILLFLVTIEEIPADGKRVIEQLYTQIWQNAYLDAAREWIKEWLEVKESCFISQSVAPGFYGIDVSCMKNFGRLLQADQLGITVTQDCYMIPEKTVVGMYFLLKHDLNIFGKRCKNCLAKGKNCEFCMDKL